MKLFHLSFHLLLCVLLTEAAKKNNICKGKPRNSVFKHPLGCKHYISCEKGTPSTGVCDEGMLFSALKPPCVPEIESECEDATRTTTKSTSSLTTTTTSSKRTSRTRSTRGTTPTTTTTTTVATTVTTTTTAATTTIGSQSTVDDAFSQFFPWLSNPEPSTQATTPSTTIAVPRPQASTPASSAPGIPTPSPTYTARPPTPPQQTPRDAPTPQSASLATTKRKRRRTTTPRATTVHLEQVATH